jgi:predicted metal-dependent enzyme (double-stranded beta helix superfamily)
VPDGRAWREGRSRRRKVVRRADAEPLGSEIIHSVTNPLSRLTGAIHIYGGDFFAVSRSEWDPETLLERNYDIEKNLHSIEDSNRAHGNWNLSSGGASL